MEMFAMTGILDRFTSQGAHLSDIHAYFGSKLTSVLPALRGTESEYSYGLFLEQLRTTAILVEELEKIGGHVDRGWEQMDIKVVTDLGVPEARPAPHGDRLAGRTRGRGGAVFWRRDGPARRPDRVSARVCYAGHVLLSARRTGKEILGDEGVGGSDSARRRGGPGAGDARRGATPGGGFQAPVENV
ncbi:hypothetical protein BG005_005406, partial [Podila minutissima]